MDPSPQVVQESNIGPSYSVAAFKYFESNLQAGYYLTTPSAADGSNIIMEYINPSSPNNQKWFLKNISFPKIAIVSRSTVGSKQFALDGGAMTAGTQLQLSEFNSSSPKPSQQWILNGNCLQLVNNNLVMDVAGGNPTAGTPVILSMIKNPPLKSQQFTLRDTQAVEVTECNGSAALCSE
ncbi:hypothetical protein EMCRGX_G025962 [Ephydatia muelleri]